MLGLGRHLARWAGSVLRCDPRVKMVALLCLSAASILVDGWPKLTLLVLAAAGWAGLAAAGSVHRRPGVLLWSGVVMAAAGLGAWAAGLPIGTWVAPVVRLVVLLTAGQAFSLSTSPGQLRATLRSMGCPNRVVLLVAAVFALLTALGAEARLAREGMRIRAACVPRKRSPLGPARAWWRAGVAFLARLFIRADLMAVAAETRGFGRPGARAAAQASRLRAADVVTAVFCIGSAAVLCLV